jgi:fused signal recognition particle receptor
MLAAGDTFRAAAVEQLQRWGERVGVPVIAQRQGVGQRIGRVRCGAGRPARQVDVLLADTAGRLQAKANLMEELKPRSSAWLHASRPARAASGAAGAGCGVGQNALSQVREFDAAVGVTGLVITKLDGTAKAGVLFAIARQLAKPVYYIGIGEGMDDLGRSPPTNSWTPCWRGIEWGRSSFSGSRGASTTGRRR